MVELARCEFIAVKNLGTVIPFLLYWAMAVQELEEIRQSGGSTTPLTGLASFSLACLVNGCMAQHNLYFSSPKQKKPALEKLTNMITCLVFKFPIVSYAIGFWNYWRLLFSSSGFAEACMYQFTADLPLECCLDHSPGWSSLPRYGDAQLIVKTRSLKLQHVCVTNATEETRRKINNIITVRFESTELPAVSRAFTT